VEEKISTLDSMLSREEAEEQLEKHSLSHVPVKKPQYAGSLASFSPFLQQLSTFLAG
jgi:hypothetical protein